MLINDWSKMVLPGQVQLILAKASKIIIPESRNELLQLAMGDDAKADLFEVAYQISPSERVVEATVARCNNGLAVNYTDIYMRRRDPDCMVVADSGETDKPRYRDRYGEDFTALRQATFDWLINQDLIVVPFMAGGADLGYPALLIAPQNAAFFAGGLADLQGFIPGQELTAEFKPKAIIYVAPPFRHTHFDGNQVVVHNRLPEVHELFSYNLYPGPSAKKGIYGV
ncbi:MAG TPA: DUF4914 family protein, partial [Bacillota bacterium]|nr:DUF4914 family protein [Bacillota bacterium]